MGILIVGAGITGLTLAIELAKQSIDFRIIDEKKSSSTDSKILIIQPRTLELFETMGIEKKILERGSKIASISLHQNKKKFLFSLDNGSSYSFFLVISQSDAEQILIEELKKWGKEVEWGYKLSNHQTLIKKDYCAEKIHYDWMIATDGSHSTIKELHIPFVSTVYPETFFLADIILKSELPQNQMHLFIQKNSLLFIPLSQANHFRMIASLEEPPCNPLDWVQKNTENFRDFFSIESLQGVSLFTFQRRIATQFERKKILLLGDVAHVHSPIGGQGMNTNIQDAFNLAWKLSYCIKKKSPLFLLRSYEKERHAVAKNLIQWTTYLTKFLNLQCSSSLFLKILASKTIQQKFLHILLGFSVHYKKKCLTCKSHLKGIQPGERVPNCIIGKNSLYTLLGKQKFVLLISSPKEEFFQAFSYEELICHQLEKQLFSQKNKIGPNEFLLIRPDGYLAMRGHFSQKKQLSDYLTNVFRSSLRK